MTEINTTKVFAQWPNDEIGDLLGGAVKKRDLASADVKGLLRDGRLRFIVAELGLPLRVVALEDCYDFWKRDVKHHLCDHHPCYAEDFEDDYFYHATEWDDGSDTPFVFLFRSH